MTLTTNQREALRVLAAFTTRSERHGPSMDVWAIAGNAKAACRARVMALLLGVPKCPQSKAGVNALRAALHAMLGVTGECLATREAAFKVAALEALKG